MAANLILFEHNNFEGAHKHVFGSVRNLGLWYERIAHVPDGVGGTSATNMNDMVSSVVILEGNWAFYKNDGFDNHLGTLGPGQYPNIKSALQTQEAGDSISSLRPA